MVAVDVGLRQAQGQPPVHQQDFSERPDHHLGWLDVAVDDVAGVGERDSLGGARQDGQVLGQKLLALHPLEIVVEDITPGTSIDLLHREDGHPLPVAPEIVDGHDVRMFQAGGDQRLVAELGKVAGIPFDARP